MWWVGCGHGVVMAAMVTVNDVLDGHVGLDLECMDRIYLNGYVPNLQVSGQVASFMTAHLGCPVPSPAIMEKIGTAFRRAVDRFADDNKIPVVRFGKDDRKIDRMRPYLARQEATGRAGVAAIGVAQEFAPVFLATKKGAGAAVWFSFTKAQRRVTCYYFYLWDDDFGPAFVKVCAYFPYPMKIWVNGHQWAKPQATKAGIGFTELSDGFATCTDPAALQAICDRLGPGTIQVFAERWWSILPLPLTEHERAAGYWWELSMRQVETSRTLVFDAPRHARGFFEALVTDNLDIGRGTNYSTHQASYDLARLRVNGLITRIPAKDRYRLTDDGLRFAIFHTKVHDRLLRPLLAAGQPPAPPPIRKSLHAIDIHITKNIEQARLLPKAA